MGNFNRNDRPGGGRNFQRRDFGGNRSMGRPQMHTTICSSCGKECQVPFKPTGEKPVYCRECFAKNGGNDANRNFNRNIERPSFTRPNDEKREQYVSKEQLEKINTKLDQILQALLANTKPIATEVKKETETIQSQEETPLKKKKIVKKTSDTPEETENVA